MEKIIKKITSIVGKERKRDIKNECESIYF